ncbi:hypothetical protein ACI48J_04485 [Paenibacillus chitinolyticus]|uniref:hypothetical protein n=1 Tax=Paenibacillus chitinolyticus TaxID=79263 RepID=UPI00386F3A80
MIWAFVPVPLSVNVKPDTETVRLPAVTAWKSRSPVNTPPANSSENTVALGCGTAVPLKLADTEDSRLSVPV